MANQDWDSRGYRFGEGRTVIGQLVEFSCGVDDVESIKAFLAERVRSIDVPTTGRVNVPHGSYGRYTRYDITQLKYAGGGGGYIEAIEIKNPPDNRRGAIVHEYGGRQGSIFYEFETAERAVAAWEVSWGSNSPDKKLPTCAGFLRRVVCGSLSPWFYAVGEQLLQGDFVFPESFEEDPTFTFGRKFIVLDGEDFPSVKTCYGMYTFKSRPQYSGYGEVEKTYRLVTWHDGTTWDEQTNRRQPIPLQDEQLWIHEAIEQFVDFLAGKQTKFSLDFRDGSRFTCNYRPANPKAKSAEGRYQVRVRLPNGKEKNSDVVWFKPTAEHPTLEAFARAALDTKESTRGSEILEVIKVTGEFGKRKWTGVFDPAVSNRLGPPTTSSSD